MSKKTKPSSARNPFRDASAKIVRPVVIDGGELRPEPIHWQQHPQQLRPQQRYAPYSVPPHFVPAPDRQSNEYDPHTAPYMEPGYMDPREIAPPPHTNVSVNNSGNFYRPWKEELALSFGKSVGNFFAFPIRLIGTLFEGILSAGIKVLSWILFAVIAPTLLYTGMQMYQASQAGESSTAAAAEVGKQAIGLIGAVLGGVWDGVFGDKAASPAE